MVEKVSPFYKLLKEEVPINIASGLNETFDSVNKALSNACELAFEEHFPGKQLVLTTDASFRSADYALMIEDNPDQMIHSKRKTYAPLAIETKNLLPRTVKNAHFFAGLPGDLHGISRVYAHFVGSIKTDERLNGQQISHPFLPNKSYSTIFVERKRLCTAFNFKLEHISGSVNTAANFSSRLELIISEKIRLKFREHVQTTPIEMTTSSSDVAEEEQVFFTQADREDGTEELSIQGKEQSWKKATECVANENLCSMKPSIEKFTKIDGKTTSCSMNGIQANG